MLHPPGPPRILMLTGISLVSGKYPPNAGVRRFCHQINTDEVFGTHTALGLEWRGNQVQEEKYQRDHHRQREAILSPRSIRTRFSAHTALLLCRSAMTPEPAARFSRTYCEGLRFDAILAFRIRKQRNHSS
jgi:hypothetical protein